MKILELGNPSEINSDLPKTEIRRLSNDVFSPRQTIIRPVPSKRQPIPGGPAEIRHDNRPLGLRIAGYRRLSRSSR